MRSIIAAFAILAAVIAFQTTKVERAASEPKAAQCDCPDNKAKDGSLCGKRSAFCRPGGVAPNCYPQDRTETQQKARKAKMCG